jgi:NAD(P)-dependent dehydrogenase (short-subunit alcohol dehydrogenase family)
MKIAVIDGMGGGIGAQIVSQLRQEIRDTAEIIALGTNAAATDRMVRAGADRGASGENAIRVSAPTADIILGPIGIVIPDAMMGEVTSVIAQAVFSSRAEKFLIPLVQQHFTIVGCESKPIGALISQAAQAVKERRGHGLES